MTKLAAALVKAQSQIEGAKKDSTNPHFKNKYADLGAVWDACREALHKNGLSVTQHCTTHEGQWSLVTVLLHESGEMLTGYVPLLNSKGDMQGLGSAITYARRYGLAAMVGVCPEDDDANAASEKPKPARAEAPVAPAGYAAWAEMLGAAAKQGTDALRAAWSAEEAKAYRQHFHAIGSDLDALKEIAAQATVAA